MHTVLIVLHLFIAIGLVTTVLLQRSEGGALGMGGGPGGLMSGRSAGNVLTRSTQLLALAFFATSIALAVFSGEQPGGGSVADTINMDELGGGAAGSAVPIGDAATPPAPDAGGAVLEPRAPASDTPPLAVPVDD